MDIPFGCRVIGEGNQSAALNRVGDVWNVIMHVQVFVDSVWEDGSTFLASLTAAGHLSAVISAPSRAPRTARLAGTDARTGVSTAGATASAGANVSRAWSRVSGGVVITRAADCVIGLATVHDAIIRVRSDFRPVIIHA